MSFSLTQFSLHVQETCINPHLFIQVHLISGNYSKYRSIEINDLMQ